MPWPTCWRCGRHRSFVSSQPSQKAAKLKFQGLKYSLANEDSRLDRRLMPRAPASIMAVAGSGSRLVSLLANRPNHMLAVDCSQEQLWLSEFRLALLREVELEDFKQVLGYPGRSCSLESSVKIINQLRFGAEAKQFVLARIQRGELQPIYWGQWETTFRRLSSPLRGILGASIIRDMRNGSALRESCFKRGQSGRWRYEAALSLFANRTWFSMLMYGRSFPVLNLAESDRAFYEGVLDRAFAAAPLNENFFLQMLFLGRLCDSNALPDEVDPVVFHQAQKAIKRCEMELVRSDVLNPWLWEDRCFDAVFLSDVPSYFTVLAMQRQISLLQSALAPEGIALLRYYRHRPIWHCNGIEAKHLPSRDELTGAYSSEMIFREKNFDFTASVKGGSEHASLESEIEFGSGGKPRSSAWGLSAKGA